MTGLGLHQEIPPRTWNTTDYLAVLDMRKGQFAPKLDDFASAIDARRFASAIDGPLDAD